MEFLTIRQEAKRSGVPEFRLRRFVEKGIVPGFFSGNKFLVNHEQFVLVLNKMCAETTVKELSDYIKGA